MYSLRELYKIGNGPSSSHTIGPLMATKEFLKRYPNLDEVRVILYGSLALTGRGHLTDYIIEKTLLPIPSRIEFDGLTMMKHPNTLEFYGYLNNVQVGHMIVYSVGGGAIRIEGEADRVLEQIYPLNTFKEIAKYCKEQHLSLAEYVDRIEDQTFPLYLKEIYETMLQSVKNGLSTSGVLPGKLQVKRKASYIYKQKVMKMNMID